MKINLSVMTAAALFVSVCSSSVAQIGGGRSLTEQNMVLIQGGVFEMGSPESEEWRNADEIQHSVTVSSFYISKYEVTQGEYSLLMKKNPSRFKGSQLPVENVSWYDAVAFCNALSEKEGLSPAYVIDGENVKWLKKADGYRLPTEAEWEYAARAGTTGSFSFKLESAAEYANFSASIESEMSGYTQKKTAAVGLLLPNANGLFDIHGNVSEWCFDIYGSYPKSAVKNPTGAEKGSARVYRGGGWNEPVQNVRSALRAGDLPANSSENRGFRIARNK